ALGGAVPGVLSFLPCSARRIFLRRIEPWAFAMEGVRCSRSNAVVWRRSTWDSSSRVIRPQPTSLSGKPLAYSSCRISEKVEATLRAPPRWTSVGVPVSGLRTTQDGRSLGRVHMLGGGGGFRHVLFQVVWQRLDWQHCKVF